MPSDIDKIFLSSEIESSPIINSNADLTDVLVRLKSGKEYTATFFTFDNVSKTVLRHKKNGRHLCGKYFWIQNMFLIDDCSRSNIEMVVNEVLVQKIIFKMWKLLFDRYLLSFEKSLRVKRNYTNLVRRHFLQNRFRYMSTSDSFFSQYSPLYITGFPYITARSS